MSLAGSCWHGNARAAKRARWRPEPARREPRNQVRQPQCRWRRRILAFRRDRTKNPPRTTLHNHSIIRVVSNNGSFRPETNYFGFGFYKYAAPDGAGDGRAVSPLTAVACQRALLMHHDGAHGFLPGAASSPEGVTRPTRIVCEGHDPRFPCYFAHPIQRPLAQVGHQRAEVHHKPAEV